MKIYMDQYSAPPRSTASLKAVTIDLEARFLAEMLTAAGLGQAREIMGGGVGEDQFASYLNSEQAKLIAHNGGIGLAESIFASLTRGR